MAAMRARMPGAAAERWDLLCSGKRLAREDEHKVEPLCRWIHAYGPAHGFRVPNVAERARHMGLGTYLWRLATVCDPQLTPRQIFDIQGNSFDHR